MKLFGCVISSFKKKKQNYEVLSKMSHRRDVGLVFVALLALGKQAFESQKVFCT